VGRKGRVRLRRFRDEFLRAHPDITDVDDAIASGRVSVDGRIIVNPESRIRQGASIVLLSERRLRGEAKLEAALNAFKVAVRDRVALDAGAAAGGFTKVLLREGARCVYAVDVGHGQLLGSLRQNPRVVTLEATNISQLDNSKVPKTIDLVTLDLSYLALAEAVPQLESLCVHAAADLVALVKPQFELRLPAPPTDDRDLREALRRASTAINSGCWRVRSSIRSPVRGTHGSVEFFVHATRTAPPRGRRAS
jgi:23S rRNA (cytidine1920-2'-O)/16S rRNA (cytidine1409-2'-O)-methyltransferase